MCNRLESILKNITEADVKTLMQKAVHYGDSWKRRGGVGAFMVTARKWDRIENQCALMKYDIFNDPKFFEKDGLVDDIRDLRCYLLLVEAEMLQRQGEPTSAYVNQD